MKFELKKLAMVLAMTMVVASSTACSKKDKEENTNNVVQQETQMESETEVDKDTQADKNENIENESQVDTDTQINSENQIDNSNDEQVDNIKDEEQSNIETVDKTISEDKALDICKEKLTGVWNIDFLRVGTDESGSDKIININDKTYYAIYYVNEEFDTIADFRFLVDQASGDMFYQSPEDLSKLIPIDEYISNN